MIPVFDVYLSADSENETTLMLMISIRDPYDCMTQLNISSVMIQVDQEQIETFMETVQNTDNMIKTNSVIKILESHNQNGIAQITRLVSDSLNRMNLDNVEDAVARK